jgi:rubredoxin/mono/diheme cytochrome c family protein
MARYECSVCGYVHDEAKEGGPWDELPDDWQCPICGATKSQFYLVDGGQAQGAVGPAAARPVSRAVTAHRFFGYVFLAIYVVLLVQMIPRLWSYQIELPARSVLHIALGMAVGVALILKILIVRFFRRLDQALVPMLGTSILVSSVVLIGISVPTVFQEALATRKLFAAENRERVETLLAQIGLSEAECSRLAAPVELRAGQRVLRNACIECHDLRTVLARPRTPASWRQTVGRMADRTTVWNPIGNREQWQVTAYLIAMSPRLQRSTQQLRDAQQRRSEAQKAATTVAAAGPAESSPYDPAAAKRLFETKCSQCHPTSLIGDAPPNSNSAARQLVTRMVGEGLEATDQELSQIVRYLTEVYAKPSE